MASWFPFSMGQVKAGGFPSGSSGEESPYSARDPGSISGSERSPGEGNDNPLQYTCLGSPMDRGAWWAVRQQGVGRNHVHAHTRK